MCRFNQVFVPLLALLVIQYSCKESSGKTPVNSYEISCAEAKQLVDSEIVFLDVRTPSEISDGKIKNAIELDFRSDDFQEQLLKLPKNDEYVVYCRSGNRSGQAMEMMKQSGFQKVKNLSGGYTAWSKQ